jgi:hypothetical protein
MVNPLIGIPLCLAVDVDARASRKTGPVGGGGAIVGAAMAFVEELFC